MTSVADSLDQPQELEGRDLLVRLHVEMDAEIARDGGELEQESLRGAQLLRPSDVGAEAVIGPLAGIHGLVVGRRDPEFGAVDVDARLHHAAEAEHDVTVAGEPQLRRLRGGVGVHLAEAGLDIHAEFVGAAADGAQLAAVQRRAHVEHGPVEQPRHAEALAVVEARQRPALGGLRNLAPVDPYPHHILPSLNYPRRNRPDKGRPCAFDSAVHWDRDAWAASMRQLNNFVYQKWLVNGYNLCHQADVPPGPR